MAFKYLLRFRTLTNSTLIGRRSNWDQRTEKSNTDFLPEKFRLNRVKVDQLDPAAWTGLVLWITMIGPICFMYLAVGILNVNSYRKYNSTATCLIQSDIFDKNMFDFHFTKTISAFNIPIFMAESVVTCMHSKNQAMLKCCLHILIFG